MPLIGGAASVAAGVVAEPARLVNTARYCFPRSSCALVNAYVGAVAPLMSDHSLPPSALICHCTAGGGPPTADAANSTVRPDVANTSCGARTMVGAVLHVMSRHSVICA